MAAEIELYTGGALAIASEQTEWTAAQIAVLRSAGVSEEVTHAEMIAFLHECQRTRLDPFTRQIYLIGRHDRQVGRKVFRSQTGIDGYRVIANRAIREENADLEYEDTLWCGPDGVWRDVWLGQNPPAAAKVVVLKNGKRFPAIATLAEYAARYPDGNPYPMWKRMPSNQLAKCAEALALRKAFPQDLAGIYTAEEMEQADARAEHVEVTTGQHEPPMASEHDRTRLVLLVKDKVGITDRALRIGAMSRHLKRPIASFKDITAAEAAATIAALSGLADFVPRPSSARYEQLHGFLGDAPLSLIDQIMHDATEARDAGEITPEDWKQLSDLADGRASALLADAAGERDWDPNEAHPEPVGA